MADSQTRKAVQNLPRRFTETDVYTLALERTAQTLGGFDHVAVFFSGGKDSTAVLNVALEVAHSDPRYEKHLPLRTIFFDEEAIPYETEEYVHRVFARPDVAGEWYALPLRHRNACSRKSPWWWPWAPEAEALWCRPRPAEAICRVDGFPAAPPAARLSNPDSNGLFFPPRLGNCVALMGIRAQESMNRQRAVTRKHGDGSNFIVRYEGPTSRGNLWKSYPAYDWLLPDVWTAPALKGWDYNRAYDRLEMAGVSMQAARCSPAFGEQPLQKLHTYAVCFPEVWAKMVDRVPGVGAAARYALTELYSYHGRPEKPAGMTWPDFLLHYTAKHDAASARSIAARIRQELRRHYQATTHPVSAIAPHPLTGISWDFLLFIAMRGDLKRRSTPGTRIRNDEHGRPDPVAWQRYATELADIIAAGRFADLAHPGSQPLDVWALVPAYAQAKEAW